VQHVGNLHIIHAFGALESGPFHFISYSVYTTHILKICITYFMVPGLLGGAVGSAVVRAAAAWLWFSASLGSKPRLARSLCQVIAAYALRLNSRAGTKGLMVSSLICDHWPILGLETLSISRCLNH